MTDQRKLDDGTKLPASILAALREDKARLDWLEANGTAMGSAVEMERGVLLDGDSIRAAIDAARSGGEEKHD